MAWVPGERRQQTWPSTVAYLARLIVVHRYAILGVLDEHGFPVREMGILTAPRDAGAPRVQAGGLCGECGNTTVIKKDGPTTSTRLRWQQDERLMTKRNEGKLKAKLGVVG